MPGGLHIGLERSWIGGATFAQECNANSPRASAANVADSPIVFLVAKHATDGRGSAHAFVSLSSSASSSGARAIENRGQRPGTDRANLRPDDALAPDVVDWSVLIVMVIGVISVAAMIVPVIGHGISDCCTPNPTHDRTDRTANNSPANSARNPSSDRAAFVGKRNLR
jgi:hypothetical protein